MDMNGMGVPITNMLMSVLYYAITYSLDYSKFL